MLESMARGERPYLLACRFSMENSRQRNSEQRNIEQEMSNVEVTRAHGTFDILRFVVA
jgi:hypothetical protein